MKRLDFLILSKKGVWCLDGYPSCLLSCMFVCLCVRLYSRQIGLDAGSGHFSEALPFLFPSRPLSISFTVQITAGSGFSFRSCIMHIHLYINPTLYTMQKSFCSLIVFCCQTKIYQSKYILKWFFFFKTFILRMKRR